MATSSLFTERIDGINGYVSVSLANNTLFWRNGSGVLGTLAVSTFATAASLAGYATIGTDQEITGAKIFQSISLSEGDAFFESNGGNYYGATADFFFDPAAAEAFGTAIGLGGYATLAGLNIFTGASVYQGGSGYVLFDLPYVQFDATAIFTGIVNFDDASEFTYTGPTAAAHRDALGLGPLATSDGSDVAYLAGNNTYTGTARFDSNTIQFIDNSFTVSGSTVANFKTAFGLGSVRKVAVPANSSSTGAVGDVAFDASFFYTCHAVNTWRRVALSTF